MNNDNKASQTKVVSIAEDAIAGIIALADRIEEVDGKPMSIDRSAARIIDKLTDFYLDSKLRAPADKAASVDPLQPIAWMNPNEGCVMDAFLWSYDPQTPRYSVPVFAAQSADKPAVDLSALPVYYMEGLENGGYYLRTDVNRALAVSASAADGSERA